MLKATCASTDAQAVTLPAPALTEAKSRWLALRLGRGAQMQPTISSQPDAAPAAAPLSVAAAGVMDRDRQLRRSLEQPPLRLATPDEGSSPIQTVPRTPFGDAAVQGGTRLERMEALTARPADRGSGEDGTQPVALISAVQTPDGRFLVDSVASGTAFGRQARGAGLPGSRPLAEAAGGASSSGGVGEGQSSARHSMELAARPRGIRRLLPWRSPPVEISARVNALPPDVP